MYNKHDLKAVKQKKKIFQQMPSLLMLHIKNSKKINKLMLPHVFIFINMMCFIVDGIKKIVHNK